MDQFHYRTPKRNEGTNDLPMFASGACKACGGTRVLVSHDGPRRLVTDCYRCADTDGLEPESDVDREAKGQVSFLTPPSRPDAPPT